jgi:hypothetical protein
MIDKCKKLEEELEKRGLRRSPLVSVLPKFKEMGYDIQNRQRIGADKIF